MDGEHQLRSEEFFTAFMFFSDRIPPHGLAGVQYSPSIVRTHVILFEYLLNRVRYLYLPICNAEQTPIENLSLFCPEC